jgi:2-alkenal reductase
MLNRSFSRGLVVLVLIGILVGVIGGGLMGAVAGYYVAQSHPVAALTSASGNAPTTGTVGSSVNNVTLIEDSAVTQTVAKAEPAVVTIVSTVQTQSRRFGRFSATAEGSGVIIDAQGHIVTNAHVVQGSQQVDVLYNDGTRVTANVVGANSARDIAVLQVSGNVPGYVPLGDSSALHLGETVVAIGNPLGDYTGSVSLGVVSGLGRSVQGTGLNNLIQTDAAINHGNSGGPLLNLEGQVVGITTLVVRQTDSGDVTEGLGFAIPSNDVSTVVKQLIAGAQ